LLSLSGRAQNDLIFLPCIKNEAIVLNHPISDGVNTYTFNVLKLYLSNFQGKNSSGETSLLMPLALVDLEHPDTRNLGTIQQPLSSISFNFGTDSLTNVSGVLDGPLDPINGMYWAWNSGYINLKAEGFFTDSLNNTIPFEFHIGGYLPPFPTAQNITFDSLENSKIPSVILNMNEWLAIVIKEGHTNVMVPGKIATEISKRIKESILLSHTNE